MKPFENKETKPNLENISIELTELTIKLRSILYLETKSVIAKEKGCSIESVFDHEALHFILENDFDGEYNAVNFLWDSYTDIESFNQELIDYLDKEIEQCRDAT